MRAVDQGLFPLLLDTVGLKGTLVAVDRSTPHLKIAQKLIITESFQERVYLAGVDLKSALPFSDDSFDGVWSADVITPDDFADIPSVVAELVRVLKPGGCLALFYGNWLRQQLLPGHSRLEHLISLAKEFTYARERTWGGQNHPECAALWLQKAGCTSTLLRFFTVYYNQPLPTHVYRFLADYSLGTFYDKAIEEFGAQVGLDASDIALWRRLSDPAGPEFILNRPDYTCVQVAMLAVGYKPLTTSAPAIRIWPT
jgi:ubiquinone/menaquinone biosynthesis C-methylase UbiE